MPRRRTNIGNCQILGCQKPARIVRYCQMHYTRLQRHGDPNYTQKTRFCEYPNCAKKHMAKGYCMKHYARFLRRGTPEPHPNHIREHPELCTKKGCDRKYRTRGLCFYHYNQKILNVSEKQYGKMMNFYQEWSKMVKTRDGSCVICNSNESLCAHHILHKKFYPKLSYNVNNGITLCLTHHKEVHGGNFQRM